MKALTTDEMRRLAEGDGLYERVMVIDATNGRLFVGCWLGIDPTSGCVYVYTDDGAYWDYEYGDRWWCYNDYRSDRPAF